MGKGKEKKKKDVRVAGVDMNGRGKAEKFKTEQKIRKQGADYSIFFCLDFFYSY